MTIKWVQTDPLVMNGEPFCYGTASRSATSSSSGRRLHAHADAQGPPRAPADGVAAAYEYAGRNRDRYAEFFEADGSLSGPGYSQAEAEDLPSQYRIPAW